MEENRKSHSFGKGLLCGILICVLVMGASGCTAAYFYPHLGSLQKTEEERQIDTKMEELNRYIDQYYLFDYEEEDIENGIYKGLMAGLGDVYTGYYTPEEYASFMESSNGSYSGIGAVLSQDYKTGIIQVVRAFAGSPAEEAGLNMGDVITSFNGRTISSMTEMQRILATYRGGEEITLTIQVFEQGEYTEKTLHVTLGYKSQQRDE